MTGQLDLLALPKTKVLPWEQQVVNRSIRRFCKEDIGKPGPGQEFLGFVVEFAKGETGLAVFCGTLLSHMRSGHGRKGMFGWLCLKGNPYPKKGTAGQQSFTGKP